MIIIQYISRLCYHEIKSINIVKKLYCPNLKDFYAFSFHIKYQSYLTQIIIIYINQYEGKVLVHFYGLA